MTGISATFTLAILTVLVATVSGRAVEIDYFQSFRLRPGETKFGLELSRFNPSDHPATPHLVSVKVTLHATFQGGLTFHEEAGLPGMASGTVGNARVMATPTTAGLLTPMAVTLAISGQQNLLAHETASIPAATTAATFVSDSGSGTLSAYSGSGAVAYDIDFTALYVQLVNATPRTTTCILCNEVVTGDIHVTYTASGVPTAVVMQSFNASWAGPNAVTVAWRTAVESNLVGFRLERKVAGGEWTDASEGMIPAAGDTFPHSYRFDDPQAPAVDPLTYRLLAIDRSGGVSVAAETVVQVGITSSIAVTGAGLEVSVQGLANTEVLIEETGDIARGPWTEVGTLMLDAQGRGMLTLAFSSAQSTRFYRVVQK